MGKGLHHRNGSSSRARVTNHVGIVSPGDVSTTEIHPVNPVHPVEFRVSITNSDTPLSTTTR